MGADGCAMDMVDGRNAADGLLFKSPSLGLEPLRCCRRVSLAPRHEEGTVNEASRSGHPSEPRPTTHPHPPACGRRSRLPKVKPQRLAS